MIIPAGLISQKSFREADWWRREGDGVRCTLCPHVCFLSPGETGRCGVRIHMEGEGLRSLSYGMVSSLAMDPIEKKPLYHWKPGTRILSFGSVGCSMRCPFCQNWKLAECAPSVPLRRISPEEPALLAQRHGAPSVAFTYNEPLTWFEFLLDSCTFLSEFKIPAVLVSNGMINAAPLDQLLPQVAAANIDLKAFTAEAYRFLGGELETVKRTIQTLLNAGKHVEVTFLLVPRINEEIPAFTEMTAWLASLDPAPVLHISRYFPNREWREPATPPERIREFEVIAKERLPWVYPGNIDGDIVTRCRNCGGVLLLRHRYSVLQNNVTSDGRCAFCSSPSPIIL